METGQLLSFAKNQRTASSILKPAVNRGRLEKAFVELLIDVHGPGILSTVVRLITIDARGCTVL